MVLTYDSPTKRNLDGTPKKEYGKYHSGLTTIGPAREEWGEDLIKWIMAFWQKTGVVWEAAPRLKFEISDDKKYPHFHLGEKSVAQKPYAAFVKQLQKYMSKYQKAKPPGYAKDSKFSIRCYAVPCSQTTIRSSKVLRGMDLINHYLDVPTKEKDVGGGNFVLEVEGFNATEHIAICRLEAAKWEHNPDYQAVLLKNVQRMEQWLSKYYKTSASEELVPLSKLLLDSQPPLKQVTMAHYNLVQACRRTGPRFF